MIDYKLIEQRLEDALSKETKESLLEWLKNHETQNQEDQRSVNVDQRVSPIFGGKEYLLCAAIYYEDGKKYEHQPKNIISGIVVCGRRHHNCYITLASLLGDNYDVKLTHNQGFVTSKDRYLERKEAAQLAFECGQITEQSKTIFSEELW